MKIGLIVDPYGEKMPGGLGRAIWELAKALVQESDNAYTVYLKRAPKERPALPQTVAVKSLEVRSVALSSGTLDKGLDAYVFFTPVIPLFFFPKRAIVVAHDFAYLELPERALRERLSGFVLYCVHYLSLRKASKIVAVSHYTKSSIIRHFRIAPEKIEVVHNGFIPFAHAPESVATPEKFFLFAGVLKERKNVTGVIRAFAELHASHPDYHLLVAGKKGGAYYAELEALVDELGVREQAHFLGYVTDPQLAYLYSKAEALVFPSFIEGFGMPALEAMQAGLPVITSNEGALAEVAGDAALLANPHDPQDIARTMRELLEERGQRQTIIDKGKERAAQFSWKKASSRLQDVIAHT
jgi:glycosyltransferase involved in cell wall biosynthesis